MTSTTTQANLTRASYLIAKIIRILMMNKWMQMILTHWSWNYRKLVRWIKGFTTLTKSMATSSHWQPRQPHTQAINFQLIKMLSNTILRLMSLKWIAMLLMTSLTTNTKPNGSLLEIKPLFSKIKIPKFTLMRTKMKLRI